MYENLPIPIDQADIPRFLDQELRKISDSFRESSPLNNVFAGAPTVNDDVRRGYDRFSKWIDITSNNIYMCADSTRAAAVWRQIG